MWRSILNFAWPWPKPRSPSPTTVCFVTPADCTTDSVKVFSDELKKVFSLGPKNLQFNCYSAVGSDLATAARQAVRANPAVIVAGGGAAAGCGLSTGGAHCANRYGGRRTSAPTAQPDGLPS